MPLAAAVITATFPLNRINSDPPIPCLINCWLGSKIYQHECGVGDIYHQADISDLP